jgi:large subunit ribosomal protein L19
MKTAAKISPVNIAARKDLDIRAGDTVKVHQKIKEGDKSRIQIFEGLVLARKHGTEAGGTFTVRKVASGVGVERIFPLYAPSIEKVEVTKRSKVRRAKLYHIREKATKEVSRQLRREVAAPETKSLAHPDPEQSAPAEAAAE